MEGVILSSIRSVGCDTVGCGWSHDLSEITSLRMLRNAIEMWVGAKCPDCRAELITRKDADTMKALISLEMWLQRHPLMARLLRLILPAAKEGHTTVRTNGEGGVTKIEEETP